MDRLVTQVEELVVEYRSKMIWTPDEERFGRKEYWKDLHHLFSDPVIDVVRCDCEDLGLSLEHGVDEEKLLDPPDISLHVVLTQQGARAGKRFDHAIAGFMIHGVRYFADNATRHPFYKLGEEPGYRFVEHSFYDMPTQWFKTHNPTRP